MEHLRDEVQVADQCSLQDDGDVGCVEELDGVGGCSSSYLIVLDGDIDLESLEVDDYQEHQDGS